MDFIQPRRCLLPHHQRSGVASVCLHHLHLQQWLKPSGWPGNSTQPTAHLSYHLFLYPRETTKRRTAQMDSILTSRLQRRQLAGLSGLQCLRRRLPPAPARAARGVSSRMCHVRTHKPMPRRMLTRVAPCVAIICAHNRRVQQMRCQQVAPAPICFVCLLTFSVSLSLFGFTSVWWVKRLSLLLTKHLKHLREHYDKCCHDGHVLYRNYCEGCTADIFVQPQVFV